MIIVFTLETFYKSDEWEALRRNLIIERSRKTGYVVCEHCHRPIFKKYDCIGHHKIPLTTENVNDLNISLNAENISLIHFKCHNEIEERFGFEKPKQVYFVFGSPLSGKSSYVKNIATKDDIILDIDSIWQMISINPRYFKPNRLKSNVFLIRGFIYDMIKCRTGKWKNAYVISSEPFSMSRKRVIDELDAIPIHVDTEKQICLERLEQDTLRDKVSWKKYIDDYFMNFTL